MIFAALGRGLAAGAAGTTALNAATYLDMAWWARPASETPKRAVDALAQRAERPVPGSGEQRDNRLEGLGALAGIITGVSIGAAAGLFGPLLDRLPRVLSGLALGAAAMAATDIPMSNLGLTDPAQWSSSDWVADAVPHAAYGLVTVGTLSALRSRSR
jgi:hypothetical protein